MARWKASVVIAGVSLVAAAAADLAAASETISYSYDAKGRLVKVVHSGSINNNVMTNYTFDPADNRKTMNLTGAP